MSKIEVMTTKYSLLQERHNAALELIGEKEETLIANKQDMKDFQTMYKDQVISLLDQIQKLQEKSSH